MSNTIRSNPSCGWAAKRTPVTTGTGGTAGLCFTVTGPELHVGWFTDPPPPGAGALAVGEGDACGTVEDGAGTRAGAPAPLPPQPATRAAVAVRATAVFDAILIIA